ncbi:MAG: polysaccharide deacetylase family protein [Steroidobacter sp.]
MIHTAKRMLKGTMVALAYRTGALQFYLRRKLRGRAVVLTYHRVLPKERSAESFSTDAIVVSPETFRRQMQLLRRLFTPLSADEFAKALAAGRMPPDACLVTFDDGWYDNLDYALPILRETGVPAVLFVATDYIDTQDCFWQERLSRALNAARQNPARSSALFAELGASHLLDASLTPPQAKLAIRAIIDRYKAQPQPEIDALVSKVEALLREAGVGSDQRHPDRFLTWEQVRQLGASGVMAIGSHCCTHTPLTKLDAASVRTELSRSRQIIRERAGIDPSDLAYPNGDHDTQIAKAVEENGYRCAYTTNRGLVEAGADAFRLRRINIHEQSTASDAAFMSRLAGLF